MKRAAVIGFALVAAVAIWFIARDLVTERRANPGETGTAATNADAGADSREAGRDLAQADRATIKPRAAVEAGVFDTATAFKISGRVVDADQQSRAGLTVRLRIHDGYEAKGNPVLLEQTATSDADGAVVFEIGRPDRSVTARAALVESDYLGSSDSVVIVRGDPPPPPLLLRAWRYDAAIIGTVLDKDGKPLPGSRVGWVDEVQTEPDGSYRYRIVTRRATVYLAARAPGFARKQVELASAKSGSTARLDFVLEPEGTLTGSVRAREGPPVAEARIRALSAQDVETRTDAAGAFRLAGFDAARDWQAISVSAAGFQEAIIQNLKFVDKQATVEVFLDPGVDVPGIVTGRDDLLVEGAEVRLGKPNYSGTITTRTDAQGRFLLKGAKPGPCEITAGRRGYAETTVPATVADPGQTQQDVPIKLLKGNEVGGVVTDASNTPVPNLNIVAKVKGDYVDKRVTTDASGRFNIEDLPATELSLETYAAGWLRKVVPVPEPRTDLTVVVERAGRLAGRVLESASKKPVQQFRIRIVQPELRAGDRAGYGYSSTWSERGHVFVNPDGLWTVDDDLVPGTVFGIEASAEGFAPARAPRVVASVDPKDGTILLLMPAASVSGKVVLEGSGAPVADVLVFAATALDDNIRSYDRRWTPSVTTRTDAAGIFTLSGIPTGQIMVVASHPNYPEGKTGPLTLGEGQRLEGVTIAISAGATIEGVCLGPDGKPSAGASIRAEASTMPTSKETRTDAAGRFSLIGLPPGFIYVTATFGGDYFDSLTVPFTIGANEKKSVTLAMDGPCTLRIDVDCDEAFPAKASVTIRPIQAGSAHEMRPQRRVPITAKGLEISGLSPEEYALTLEEFSSARPGMRGEAKVVLEPSKRAEVRIKLRREQ